MPQQAEDMVNSMVKTLKEKYPNVSEKTLRSRAYAIVQSHWKKKFGRPAFS